MSDTVTKGSHVACESMSAIVVHLRRLGPGIPPIRLSGHSEAPFALCGAVIAWDRTSPVNANNITCRRCRALVDWINSSVQA